MSHDKDYIAMEPDAFTEYIKRCPTKYKDELPKKLEEWAKQYAAKEALKNMHKTPITFHPAGEEAVAGNMRLEISKAIIVYHAPTAVSDPVQLADYAVEMADALVERLKR